MTFQALLLTQADGATEANIATLDEGQLPADGDVLVAVDYSTINFKDGLAITGRSPVVRKWPMVAGIDGAGTVLESAHPRWKAGDKVVLNGYGVGETHWGCLAQRARLKGDWLVPLPAAFTTRQAMAIGTAGYTAMLSVLALERGGVNGPVRPGEGEVLVTGASGGVGSVAIALLSKLGYQVVASTGKTREADFLKALGAADVIDRAELGVPGKPLQKERWAAVVDSVGSHTLVNACAQVRYGGVVTACGLAQGLDFPGSVAPFILRGITLHGIDSVMAAMPLREQAWQRLASDLELDRLNALTREIGLGDAIEAGRKIMEGGMRGRVVVDVNRG
ncbi:putative oxidoreductase, Zn-dependent and NAD(P)-binding [Cupriavidus taiwanensis]|uniref:Putative oxidoreductase, Zn-dependent and NAD(P)-binding n=1 Tax=Cupriavidus taiwanensis TaxID=164546 RepID=A0A375IA16_9BURK|nr:MDR family oxidoreductase [Cupriavidus taiwanensis]SOY51591.1 putative NADPH:quinone reductase, GroES-like domain [Cupriavidus taiwanensis]SOY51834.1 putative NADPH:quinone reductase, GroES-like domain [Cupriavidus taiwanensis]SOY84333.1 putative NADPH:quinone reductase, GroES-like domain [Cupriavidus taiwanensis]SPA15336.1 putative NADPH:quinone reductase, GroES-like domain [Cupriavidus taiwanensis]SPD44571.1 putative oxidoreductase, Zn-dependent and NAD(P)-binding [Cupriavidus taiwanensis